MTRRPGIMPVALASGAAFLAVFGGLSAQLRAGRDPALGDAAEKKKSQPATSPRRVLVRRVIERRVVVHVVPAPKPAAVPAAGGGGTVAAPAAAASAPRASAPAAAPAPVRSAPAPAPAPAPVTRSS